MVINTFLYVIIILFILYFILFLFIPLIKNYSKEKKTNWEINNLKDYYSKNISVPSIGNVLSNLLGIVAIIIAIYTYIGSNEQIVETKKGFDSTITAYNKMISGLNSISKSSDNIKNNFELLSNTLKGFPIKIDSITLSLLKLNSIISEQIKLTEKEYYLKLNPLLIANSIENVNRSTLDGFNLVNIGNVDAENIMIMEICKSYSMNKNVFGFTSKSLGYNQISKLLKVSDSIYIPFDMKRIKTYIANMNVEKNLFPEYKNDEMYIVIMFKIKYKKPRSNSYYITKKIFVCYEGKFGGVTLGKKYNYHNYIFIKSNDMTTFDDLRINLLINKVDSLDNRNMF